MMNTSIIWNPRKKCLSAPFPGYGPDMSGNSGAFLKSLGTLNIDYKSTTHLVENLVNILITNFSSPNPWLH
jgi:hypothetical protein